MENKAVIISGEASESDEEPNNAKAGIPFPLLLASTSCGTMIHGEAKESDEENNSISSTSYTVDPGPCSYMDMKSHKSERSSVKYNSLLHQKLRECNKSLKRNVQEFWSSTISNSVEQLNNINKQLLKSELMLQETVSKSQTAMTQFEETLNCLNRIVEEDFFQTVKL